MVKLSILDQSPISTGQTAQEALQASVRLAQLGEDLGYERFWIAEHHDLFGLACPNPDVMLGVIGSQTEKIRIGAGAVLLPYYKPFRVAETYNLLATLFPNRIDLGIGRAPGGSAEASLALSDNYLTQVNRYSELIDELHHFLHQSFPQDSTFAKVKPTPVPDTPPKTWMLGTSKRSSKLALEKKMAYAFGHFMTDFDGVEIVRHYRKQYEKRYNERAEVIVAVHAICAETEAQADELAKSTLAWSLLQEKAHEQLTIPSLEEVRSFKWTEEEQVKMTKQKETMIIGNPEKVAEELHQLAKDYDADELMLVTITHEASDKRKSYELIKNAWDSMYGA